jgi:hypothetical protein
MGPLKSDPIKQRPLYTLYTKVTLQNIISKRLSRSLFKSTHFCYSVFKNVLFQKDNVMPKLICQIKMYILEKKPLRVNVFAFHARVHDFC